MLGLDGYSKVIGLKFRLDSLKGALKPQNSGPQYSNTVIGTLAVDGRTFDSARRGLGKLRSSLVPSSLYQM